MRYICQGVLLNPARIGALLFFQFLHPLLENIGAVEQSALHIFGLLKARAGLLLLIFHSWVRQVVDSILRCHEVDRLTLVLDHTCSFDIRDYVVQSAWHLLLVLIEVGLIVKNL